MYLFGYRALINLLLEALTKKEVRLHTAMDSGVLPKHLNAITSCFKTLESQVSGLNYVLNGQRYRLKCLLES